MGIVTEILSWRTQSNNGLGSRVISFIHSMQRTCCKYSNNTDSKLQNIFIKCLLLFLQVPYLQSELRGSNNRISNGYIAEVSQLPYQVAVSSTRGLCGGSIISPSWVLTVAHCLGAGQYNLRFGSIDRLNGGIAQTSFHGIAHPSFDLSVNLNNDIGLIWIPSTLQFNDAISAVRLPTLHQANNNFVNSQAIVSGWGITRLGGGAEQFLRWVRMHVITNDECRKFFVATTVVDHVMCAIGTDWFQGHCSGDSGGPLTIAENNEFVQIGIVSFSMNNGCGAGFPMGYVRTTSFLNWIAWQTGIELAQLNCDSYSCFKN